MPHGNHIYAKASYMANATMCTYPQSKLGGSLRYGKIYKKNIKKLQPLLGFTFITSLDVVLLMVEFH